jgi:ribosomal protein S18 acetylase RimI-like enzyme
MEITINPLTPERSDDFFRFFEQVAYPDHVEWGRDCYCCFFHAASKTEWEARTGTENRTIAAQMIRDGELRGLLAYVGDMPVGWCHFDRKSALPGLQVFYPALAAAGDPQTGAIVCFTVAQGYRGQGVARLLLAAACRELADLGCTLAEAYPLLRDSTAEENYHGTLSMYLSQGFVQAVASGGQAIVRKALTAQTAER